MSCIHCGATLAYNPRTGSLFVIAYARPLTIDDHCATHAHVSAQGA